MRRKEDKSRDLLPPQRPAGRLPGAEHVSGTQAAAGSAAGKQVSLPGLQCGETSGKSEASKMHSPSGGAEDGEGSGAEGRPLGAAFILKTQRLSADGPLSSKPVTITSVSQGSPPTKLLRSRPFRHLHSENKTLACFVLFSRISDIKLLDY